MSERMPQSDQRRLLGTPIMLSTADWSATSVTALLSVRTAEEKSRANGSGVMRGGSSTAKGRNAS